MLSAGSAAARRITVGDDDYKDYSSIQEAVDAAKAGDIVYVYSGLYRENVDLEKEISIRSISGTPENFIVKAKDPGDHVFHVKANNVTISGFSIKGASDPEKAGIYLESTHGTMISNNLLSDNHLGIYLSESNTNMLNVNDISGNYVGIYLQASRDNWVINNKAKENFRKGIFLQASDENRLTGNILLLGIRSHALGQQQEPDLQQFLPERRKRRLRRNKPRKRLEHRKETGGQYLRRSLHRR